VAFVPYEPRTEATLEQVATATVAVVEKLRVSPVQRLHSRGELRCRRRNDDVVVRVHEAVSVDRPTEPIGNDREQIEEVEPVHVVPEDRRRTDPVRGDVEDAVGKFAPPQPCHLRRR